MQDEDGMRRAFAVARRARANGNPPFGALLVDGKGAVVLEAENTATSERDCTGHAETNLIRQASRRFGALSGYTMYTSAEPCCMCTGAAFWSGLGRIVYGLSAKRLASLRGDGGPPMLDLSCRDVIARGQRAIAVAGPLLEDEAAALFAER
jgi:tRNA(Arg) A34 adenosine deaminase TadA